MTEAEKLSGRVWALEAALAFLCGQLAPRGLDKAAITKSLLDLSERVHATGDLPKAEALVELAKQLRA